MLFQKTGKDLDNKHKKSSHEVNFFVCLLYYIGMNEIDADNDIMMKIIHHNNAPA